MKVAKNEHLTLILGGARSGKSNFAESLVLQSGLEPVYVATATADDAEMKTRIEKHAKARAGLWQLIEEQTAISRIFYSAQSGQILLVDCLTLWLSNLVFAGKNVETEAETMLNAARRSAARIVFVSNEIGMGLVPDNALGRRFRDQQGALNQRVAALSDQVFFVAAGLPLALKGALP